MASAKRGLNVHQVMSCTSRAISSRVLPETACFDNKTRPATQKRQTVCLQSRRQINLANREGRKETAPLHKTVRTQAKPNTGSDLTRTICIALRPIALLMIFRDCCPCSTLTHKLHDKTAVFSVLLWRYGDTWLPKGL